MSAEFYLNKLYPLQDAVLQIISAIPSKLYLTGGTALSRVYLGHRFSDDIDLFMNWDSEFQPETQKVFDALKKQFADIETPRQEENFARVFVKQGDVALKMEFVNDVGYHAGDFLQCPLYHKVDNPQNILSNKLCALSREVGKDLADIIYLCKRFQFNWENIVNDARKKDNWVNEVDVSKRIYEFPAENMRDLNWVAVPDFAEIKECQKRIAKDILLATDNSLFTVF